MKQLEAKKKTSNLVWIISGLLIIIAFIGSIFYLTRSQKVTDIPSLEEFKREHERRTKLIKILSEEESARITHDILFPYLPEIEWWEANSLSELDKKIKSLNELTNKNYTTIFSDGITQKDFDEKFKELLEFRNAVLITSIKKSLKVTDFSEMVQTLKKKVPKASLATQDNYQKIEREIKRKNSLISSLCSKFVSLNDISSLDKLLISYFDLYVSNAFYSFILREFLKNNKSLNIVDDENYDLDFDNKTLTNKKWNIALKKVTFKKNISYSF
ncbi:hypothetical protein [endosymbiont GvMRE of Glomus versiforme]|uniref:hypothetical protein n=1 Tax=endosymbiont GvMRE of Glomus versiforme TaxID=2039283 RepID=UPI000EB85C7D|nr:hypothetical protein [endosymbiont GvMRE of Glomus versiforme]RHZ35202.1 hypothetical protein GvMRE_IIg113 [endosymbiont GvMRE of Glomus versiforme]